MPKNLNIIILSILTCLFLGKNCIKSYAQDSTPTLAYQIVQVKPTFNKGDLRTFPKWLSRQIIYPDIATSRGIEGKVIIQFTVQTDGTVNNVKVLRGVDPLIDNEAIRVVKKSPKWQAGKHENKTVNVVCTYPMMFKIME